MKNSEHGQSLRQLLAQISPSEVHLGRFLVEISKNRPPIILEKGEVLIQQGEYGNYVFFVLEGRFRATHEQKNGKSIILGEIGQDEMVGEMSMVTGEVYSATVKAMRKSTVLPLDKYEFATILHKYPLETLDLLHTVLTRSKKMYKVESSMNIMAIIGQDPNLDLDDFVKKFSSALEKYGSTSLLDQNQLNGMKKSKLVDWFSIQRKRFDFLIFQIEGLGPESIKHCLSLADRVMIVADATAPVDLREVEKVLMTKISDMTSIQSELVLVQPNRNIHPTNTIAWLQAFRPAHFYHIGKHHIPDYKRLARRITNNSIAMVFGGGGARGYAQYGVVRAFQEEGIEIDLMGGSSAGSYVAASLAMELDHQKSMEFMQTIANEGNLKDYTLPLMSLFSGKMGTQMAQEYCGDWKIEDLWIPFFAIAASLKTGNTVVQTEGSLWEAVRSSTSLPGILPPFWKKGDLLVDGGVINNAPVDIAARFSPGKIILISTIAEREFTGFHPFPPAISGWSLFWTHLNPFRKKIIYPKIASLLMRSYEVTANYLQQKTLQEFPPDLIISPPVEKYGMLDYKLYDKIEEGGYQYAKLHMKEWKTLLNLDNH